MPELSCYGTATSSGSRAGRELLTVLWTLARSVPWYLYAISACLVWGGWERHRALSEAASLNSFQKSVAAANQKILSDALVESSRRVSKQQEELNASAAKVNQAQSAAAVATRNAASLRTRLSAYSAIGPADTFSTLSSKASVLSGLLGECSDRYGQVAAVTDSSIIAGQLCVSSYEALSK